MRNPFVDLAKHATVALQLQYWRDYSLLPTIICYYMCTTIDLLAYTVLLFDILYTSYYQVPYQVHTTQHPTLQEVYGSPVLGVYGIQGIRSVYFTHDHRPPATYSWLSIWTYKSSTLNMTLIHEQDDKVNTTVPVDFWYYSTQETTRRTPSSNRADVFGKQITAANRITLDSLSLLVGPPDSRFTLMPKWGGRS